MLSLWPFTADPMEHSNELGTHAFLCYNWWTNGALLSPERRKELRKQRGAGNESSVLVIYVKQSKAVSSGSPGCTCISF